MGFFSQLFTPGRPVSEKEVEQFELEQELSRAPGPERRRHPHYGIQLRRFAGPQSHVGELEHIRILHLTDLHVGRVTPMKVQQSAVELTNLQKPDLVVITGDFVCHSQEYLEELEDLMKGFNAPVMGVLGNHDY